MVESTALEMRRTGNRIGGSNPSLSAILTVSGDILGRPAVAVSAPSSLAVTISCQDRDLRLPVFGKLRRTDRFQVELDK